MRRTSLHAGIQIVAFLAFVAFLIGLTWTGEAIGWVQQKGQATAAVKGGTVPTKSKLAAAEYISFPADRDAQQLLEAVQQYIREAKGGQEKWDRICEAAQRVLNIKSDSFFEVETEVDGEKKKDRVSVKVHANRLIGSFTPAGRQFYQLTYGPAAQQELDDAIKANYDRSKLADISQRYFHTKAGAEATILLGSLFLDRGQYLEAAYTFERILDRPDAADWLTPRVAFKAGLALKRTGDPAKIKQATQLWTDLARKWPREGVVFGNRTYAFEEIKAEYDRAIESIDRRATDLYATMRYGNPSHTAQSDGGTVFLDPNFMLPMVQISMLDDAKRKSAHEWIQQNLDLTLKRIASQKNTSVIPGFFPLTAPGVLIYRNYDSIVCVAAKEGPIGSAVRKPGDVIWRAPLQRGLFNLAYQSEQNLNSYLGFYQSTIPGITFENPLTGTVSHDGKSVYFVDDMAVPPPPQNATSEFGGARFQQQTDNSFGPFSSHSLLCQINMETGKLVWDIGGPGGGNTTDEQDDAATHAQTLFAGAFFLGPPLPLLGKLYVLFEKNAKLRIACLDPDRLQPALEPDNFARYPTILWTQRIGEPKDRLPADSIRRFQGSFLAYADGVLVVGTNTGAVVGIDIMSRSLLWAHSYRLREGAEEPDPAGQEQLIRRRVVAPTMIGAGMLQQGRWRAAAPIIANGRVIVTAYDSKTINCIDLRSGSLIWYDAMDTNDDLYIGGVMSDRVLVIGAKNARAYDLNANPPDPKTKKLDPVWKQLAIGSPCGHGAPSKNGLYYLPLARSADSELPQIWAIDPVKGTIHTKMTYRRKLSVSADDEVPLGNLVFHEGQLYAQSPKNVYSFSLIELKRKAMDELLKANPNDPNGLAARGELKLDDGRIDDALVDLRAAAAGTTLTESNRLRVRDKLYQAYTELLKADFTTGEKYLGEYKPLLEVPLTSDDAGERQKAIDEQLKRKARYLSLLAKGREKQGRLTEAFAHYREFATLGDNKTLIPIDGEPFGLVRPDVWARGRIDAMIRSASSANLRKPLEDLVAQEWNSVRDGSQIGKLREFVSVFGPYFPAGKEAQLILAEKLLATGTEDDAREAEVHLLQLTAEADGESAAARAVHALAGVMLRKQLYEDAVALYAQLGSKYESVAVKNGKTGSELFADLLTDRRLLPHLEPTRERPPGPCKVERRDENNNRIFVTGFTIEPEGNLLPFYQRFRLTIEMNNNGSANWTLKVADKVTGAVRCKFENLYPPVNFNIQPQQSWSDIKLARASGHIVLLHFGLMVYCVDLAEKKMLWQYNLVAGSSTAPNVRQQSTAADGEMSIVFEDGWMVRLGRSALIQAGFACLLTRDGLVALDLMSGQKMWQHAGVSPKAVLFGDGRYVLIAESGDGKPGRSKVIRAVDGTTVDGIADFSALALGTTRIGLSGRNLLINDAKGLRLFDPIAAKDLWNVPMPAGTKVVRTYDPGLIGTLSGEGTLHLRSVETGAVTFTASIDASRRGEHLKNLTQPFVLTDSDRVYLVLNQSVTTRNQVYYGYMPVRTVAVTGPIYCFQKGTAKRLWYSEGQFDNQQLVLDRFAEMPVLLAANHSYDPQNGSNQCEVVAVDKALGKVKFRDTRMPPNGPFQMLNVDGKSGKFELIRYDTKIIISPTEPPRDAPR